MQTLKHCGKLSDPKKLKVDDRKNRRHQKEGKNTRLTQRWLRKISAL
ncbi:hypothetical protein LINPERPRIM_LOCUS25247 [Linum perenne]